MLDLKDIRKQITDGLRSVGRVSLCFVPLLISRLAAHAHTRFRTRLPWQFPRLFPPPPCVVLSDLQPGGAWAKHSIFLRILISVSLDT